MFFEHFNTMLFTSCEMEGQCKVRIRKVCEGTENELIRNLLKNTKFFSCLYLSPSLLEPTASALLLTQAGKAPAFAVQANLWLFTKTFLGSVWMFLFPSLDIFTPLALLPLKWQHILCLEAVNLCCLQFSRPPNRDSMPFQEGFQTWFSLPLRKWSLYNWWDLMK